VGHRGPVYKGLGAMNPCYNLHLHTHIHTFIHTYIHTYVHIYIHTHINTYIHAYIHAYIHTYLHTHTYIYTYIHTYILTYINTYVSTYICTKIRQRGVGFYSPVSTPLLYSTSALQYPKSTFHESSSIGGFFYVFVIISVPQLMSGLQCS
jgi:ABC-type uncharacterized transport system permease subunit